MFSRTSQLIVHYFRQWCFTSRWICRKDARRWSKNLRSPLGVYYAVKDQGKYAVSKRLIFNYHWEVGEIFKKTNVSGERISISKNLWICKLQKFWLQIHITHAWNIWFFALYGCCGSPFAFRSLILYRHLPTFGQKWRRSLHVKMHEWGRWSGKFNWGSPEVRQCVECNV